MKLLKFNLVFIPLLLLCLGAVSYTARELLVDNAREHIVQNARIMMETASSSRTYTTKQVAPLLQHKNFKLRSAIAEFQKTLNELPKEVDASIPKDVHYPSAKKAYLLGQQKFLAAQQQLVDSAKARPGELDDAEFHPQSVPAYAATEIFNYLREKYPEYFYKEATLNPTNPRDRANDWEADVVNQFRNGQVQKEFMGTRATPTGDSLYLARPLKITNASCLSCHTSAEKSPPEMVKLYGPANGFGWKMDEIIGAQIVSVPMSLPIGIAEAAWYSLLKWIAAAGAGILVVANACVALFMGRG